jgi:predicted nucleic acid-binding protein
MNGRNERLIVLDSNVVIDFIDFINRKLAVLPESDDETVWYCVSVVTEMEALAKPTDSPETRAEIRAMLSEFIIVPLSDEVKTIAPDIRRSGSPRPRLPDAIVAATAVAFEAPLVTRDEKLLRLQWPGLHTADIA